MKTQVAILIFISFLLASCAPATPTQENEVVNDIATEEPVFTEEPAATEPPTEAPTEPPLACVTLLTPIDGLEIPPVGKVTFSWTAMDIAGHYILNIILPSGEVVPFETDQTFRDRYMEAFVAGGEYQWQVVAQNVDGSEICVSEVATFDKPAYEKSSGGGGEEDGGSGCPWGGCGPGGTE